MDSSLKRKFFEIDQVTGNSSISFGSRGEYEVFLSFSGTDTRKGFTDFLYTYLIDANISTFRDDNELRVGEEISGELLIAIKESKISIPVFSKSYASSKWCLRELAQMVECHTHEGQMIYPIFYDVTPFEVRNQTGWYEEAFCLHEKKFDELTVQGWKEAMKKVGKLKGLELMKETNGHEGKLVKKIVQDVLLVLKKNYTHVDDNLVGMDGHVKAMNELLNLDSDRIRVVGIHGMGGLGKTTIAKVIYSQVSDRFECCCFLEDVRANSISQNGIVNLQKKLLCMIRKGGVGDIDNVDEGIAKIKGAIGTKKVFIVLDDVDDKYQLDKLVGECLLFGVGSRILVTTRNKEVLDTLEATYQSKNIHDVYGTYEPHLLKPINSLKLFSRYAFMRDSPPEDFDILSKKVVSRAGGLPLVLVTIGSLLFGKKDISLWEEKLRKLEEIPHEKVLERLRISYNALEYTQKQIFLDIACFFIGVNCIYPCYLSDSCGFYPRDGLNALVLRHMVELEDDNKLRMHDHLRDLGRQIVREENMSEQGERSRLWSSQDALDSWNRRMLTTKVQALDLVGDDFAIPHYSWSSKEADDIDACFLSDAEMASKIAFSRVLRLSQSQRLVGDDFVQLRNVRFLRLGCADLDGDFKHHLSNLRWLEWECPGNFWPDNCHLKNLMILDLRYSCMTDDWKGWREIKMAVKLKVLNLSWCCGLKRGPVFSEFTTLEILCLKGCKNLEEINSSPRCLKNLRVLDISLCPKLGTFDCSHFSALEVLNLRCCQSLHTLDCCKHLDSLRDLDMRGCRHLKTLPGLSNFKKLEKLQLSDCHELIEIQGLDTLECLEGFVMRSSKYLKRLPNLSNLRMLQRLDVSLCEKLLEVDELESLESLEDLNIESCRFLEELPNLSNLVKLKKLCVSGCWKLNKVEGLGALKSLESLDLSNCSISLEQEANDFSNLKNLKYLRLCGVKSLVEIGGLEELKSLELLDIRSCSWIEKLPDLSNHENLRQIYVYGCTKLTNIRTTKACAVYQAPVFEPDLIEIRRHEESNH